MPPTTLFDHIYSLLWWSLEYVDEKLLEVQGVLTSCFWWNWGTNKQNNERGSKKGNRRVVVWKISMQKNYLFQAIDSSILEKIFCKDTSKHIWDSMKKKYQGSMRAKRQQLQVLCLKFETLRIKLGKSIIDYFSCTMTIVNKMWDP